MQYLFTFFYYAKIPFYLECRYAALLILLPWYLSCDCSLTFPYQYI